MNKEAQQEYMLLLDKKEPYPNIDRAKALARGYLQNHNVEFDDVSITSIGRISEDDVAGMAGI